MTTTVSPNTVTESMAAGWQLPAYLYSDPSIYAIERELVFRQGWIYVGLTDKLTKTGDYFTAEVGDIPIVVTRDGEGNIGGLVNACLHRLHPIASGEGCSRLLQCKYHGWTYGLDGALKTAPRSQHEPGFDKKAMQLPTVRVEAFGRFLFANVDPEAPSLHDYLADAPGLVDALAIDIGQWKHAGSFRYEVDANWKLFMENSLECYHCDLVHHDTFATAIATGPDDYICDNYANVLTQVAPIQHAPDTETRAVDELEKFRMLYIWPTTAFSVDEYAGVITRLIPMGPTRCAWVVDVFEKPGVDPAVLESWMEMYDRTFKEDKAVVSAQQAGYDSGMIPQGRLMPTNGSSIAMFQPRTWEALAPALEGR